MALTPGARKAGSWIRQDAVVTKSTPLPLFRREFRVTKEAKRATLLIAGLGFYEATLNGQKVGDAVLTPIWTNYRRSVRYEAFDVTRDLVRGRNVLAVMLGNGPYKIDGDRYTKYKASFGEPCLWAQLHLEFEQGASMDVSTDENWRWQSGPITFSDFYGGEDYDARKEPDGWRQAGFNDSSWRKVNTFGGPGGNLVADAGLDARVRQEFKAVRITRPRPGTFVYDLGQNFSGCLGSKSAARPAIGCS